MLTSALTQGQHIARENAPGKRTPLELAEAWMRGDGWRYPDDDFADVLAGYGVDDADYEV